jgi:hypothetical protein
MPISIVFLLRATRLGDGNFHPLKTSLRSLTYFKLNAVGTFRLIQSCSAELQHHLDAIADAIDPPRSWVVTRALEAFVESEAWQIEEIKRADLPNPMPVNSRGRQKSVRFSRSGAA